MLTDLSIRDVTAVAGDDYLLPATLRVTFDPGDPNKEITIDVIADNSKEDTEIFEIYIHTFNDTDVVDRPGIAVINIKDASAKSKFIIRRRAITYRFLRDVLMFLRKLVCTNNVIEK